MRTQSLGIGSGVCLEGYAACRGSRWVHTSNTRTLPFHQRKFPPLHRLLFSSRYLVPLTRASSVAFLPKRKWHYLVASLYVLNCTGRMCLLSLLLLTDTLSIRCRDVKNNWQSPLPYLHSHTNFSVDIANKYGRRTLLPNSDTHYANCVTACL